MGLEVIMFFRLNGFGNFYILVVNGFLDRERVVVYNIIVIVIDGGIL